ncbi:MAG TPA: TMEM175 family protein [Dokdonella sp.]|uniref:TMEM175 family protein n=1 Tax=Dokdonella sp. TaxID=2291710 RepID=UPI002D7FB94A|nr:TMEM175 family protein [Dokdonella sp.]HET9033374.1 TMEM175 family protein [Dokdonella sp.]
MAISSKERNRDGFIERGAEVTRLEAFIDAAFAFAVTLLVISVDTIPASREEMLIALKGVPAFAVSFAMIAVFWYGHAAYTRRYGLDDLPSTLLGLTLVFFVLVFVYPLKVMFAAFFARMSDGWLPAHFMLESREDWIFVFLGFGVVFATMGTVLALLTRHAWNLRDQLGLDIEERVGTRCVELSWWLIPIVSLISIALTVVAASAPEIPWLLGLPGPVYMLLAAQYPLITWFRRRLLRKIDAQTLVAD